MFCYKIKMKENHYYENVESVGNAVRYYRNYHLYHYFWTIVVRSRICNQAFWYASFIEGSKIFAYIGKDGTAYSFGCFRWLCSVWYWGDDATEIKTEHLLV